MGGYIACGYHIIASIRMYRVRSWRLRILNSALPSWCRASTAAKVNACLYWWKSSCHLFAQKIPLSAWQHWIMNPRFCMHYSNACFPSIVLVSFLVTWMLTYHYSVSASMYTVALVYRRAAKISVNYAMYPGVGDISMSTDMCSLCVYILRGYLLVCCLFHYRFMVTFPNMHAARWARS